MANILIQAEGKCYNNPRSIMLLNQSRIIFRINFVIFFSAIGKDNFKENRSSRFQQKQKKNLLMYFVKWFRRADFNQKLTLQSDSPKTPVFSTRLAITFLVANLYLFQRFLFDKKKKENDQQFSLSRNAEKQCEAVRRKRLEMSHLAVWVFHHVNAVCSFSQTLAIAREKKSMMEHTFSCRQSSKSPAETKEILIRLRGYKKHWLQELKSILEKAFSECFQQCNSIVNGSDFKRTMLTNLYKLLIKL